MFQSLIGRGNVPDISLLWVWNPKDSIKVPKQTHLLPLETLFLVANGPFVSWTRTVLEFRTGASSVALRAEVFSQTEISSHLLTWSAALSPRNLPYGFAHRIG